MIIGVIANKGGVGKTNTSVHLAGLLNETAPALLVDADLNRSSLAWSRRGALPFRTIDEKQAAKYSRDYETVIIDTGARMDRQALEAMADGCDMLLLVTMCDALSLDALLPAAETLQAIGSDRYKILINAAPPVGNAGQDTQQVLRSAGLPVFDTIIRRYAAYQRAALSGCLVGEVSDPYAETAWSDFTRLGREIR